MSIYIDTFPGSSSLTLWLSSYQKEDGKLGQAHFEICILDQPLFCMLVIFHMFLTLISLK